jgi:hypothetical protein
MSYTKGGIHLAPPARSVSCCPVLAPEDSTERRVLTTSRLDADMAIASTPSTAVGLRMHRLFILRSLLGPLDSLRRRERIDWASVCRVPAVVSSALVRSAHRRLDRRRGHARETRSTTWLKAR